MSSLDVDPRKPSLKTGQAPWSPAFMPNHCKFLAIMPLPCAAQVMQKPCLGFAQ